MLEQHQILIVEDDPAIARGLEYGFKREGFEVIMADTGRKALESARAHGPQVILLDARLPDMSGFDVLRQLRAESRRMPILMVTARDEEVDRVLGLEMGADDYIVKPFSLRELISRVRASLRRAYGELSAPGGAEELRFADVVVSFSKMSVTRAGKAINLTPTEFRLLRHLLINPGIPFSRDALVQEVWGYDDDVFDDRTVDVHMRHLREKLEDIPAEPRYLITVRGVGYKFEL
ncbi:MAG TPA: response regulator transcription factor [Thermoflexales bacterium]|nr:response regulator transcription factor [Thermoflexales bacterium]